MTLDQVFTHFGSAKLTADALDITPQAISQWRTKGYIPMDTQRRLQLDTGGVLVANPLHAVKGSHQDKARAAL